MLAVVTRVKSASVCIDGETHGEIKDGLCCLLGVRTDDTTDDAALMASRLRYLRIFEDADGKMNLDAFGAGCPNLLLVSQFTLFGDTRQRRPGFTNAARPETAVPLYEKVITLCREAGFNVQTGVFGADMQLYSQNDGPVTLIIDTKGRSAGGGMVTK